MGKGILIEPVQKYFFVNMHYKVAAAYNQPPVLSKHGSSDHHCHIFNMIFYLFKKTFGGM